MTRLAHVNMLSEGLLWLKDRALAAAASVHDTDPTAQRLWISLNSKAPSSCIDAWNNRIAGREIHSEELRAEVRDIFHGPSYVGLNAVLYINAIGSMTALRNGTVSCACFLERCLGKRGDPDSIVCELLYIVPVAAGGAAKDLPISVGPWCITNLQPTGDCELPPGLGV